jgi:MraZ protein
MTSFLSTFANKVDRKGRVSVPAPFRAALAGQSFQGIVAYPSLADPAIDAVGRDVLDQMIARRFDRTLEDGDFEQILLGGGDSLVETVLAMVSELPFDGEGRIVLPKPMADSAEITDRATFVGRGTRFQVWAPEAFERHQAAAIDGLRTRLAGQDAPGGG